MAARVGATHCLLGSRGGRCLKPSLVTVAAGQFPFFNINFFDTLRCIRFKTGDHCQQIVKDLPRYYLGKIAVKWTGLVAFHSVTNLFCPAKVSMAVIWMVW